MSTLSLKEINDIYPEKVYSLPVHYNPSWWEEIILNDFPEPIIVEFEEEIRLYMSDDLKNSKGIYMFFLDPQHPFNPKIHYLVYIGRVLEGETDFNFGKRIYDYTKSIGSKARSRNKTLLTNLWPGKTYVYYYPLNNMPDEDIVDIEDLLINKIVPPLNNQFKGVANQTRDLYN